MAASVRAGEGTATAVFVHANGFCKETWEPVASLVGGAGRIVLYDQRGHGGSSIGPPPFDWWDLGRDAAAVAGALAPQRPRIGVGHSSGGAALVLSELLVPGTWDALVLIEPIVTTPPFERWDDHPLAVGARRRRDSFASRDEAALALRHREAFRDWTDAAFDAYIDCGLVDRPDGSVMLACPREVEAEFFATSRLHGAWDRLGEIGFPVALLAGERSRGLDPGHWALLCDRFPAAHLEVLPGASHFLPMEQPAAVAAAVAAALGG